MTRDHRHNVNTRPTTEREKGYQDTQHSRRFDRSTTAVNHTFYWKIAGIPRPLRVRFFLKEPHSLQSGEGEAGT